MKMMFKAALLAATPFAVAAGIVPVAVAQAAGNVGVADVQGAIQKTNAFTTAMTQMKTTYAAPIAAFDARSKALQASLQPEIVAFQAAQKAPNANQATLQTQYAAIQQKQQAAQAELQRLSAPIARAQAYVEEQIGAKLDAAIKTAMTAKGITLVVAPQAAISYVPSVDLTDAIVAELNKSVPTASITPPTGWAPNGQGAPGNSAAPQGR
ncbi:OmpH family outer membrane protein [Sphingomonas paeninsulae]|jgi:Skp family chaperone for outer membrane proteins|uniref:OmpH family outer membrane protein n=1 Tax=Sphingomonas paeninsulae TaxID=2319844 RepID=A0A494T8F8_SPHPE|nr:OmpH family outer membrane protein [Sphingomonas paeninsulae]AYJ85619.1 OmpH family outer membrane protein [Sphingomonas paeninsulae]